jgi:exonuclease SbcD
MRRAEDGCTPMFRFLHAADIHLDSPLRGLDRYEGAPVEQAREATRGALGKLVALARAEKVDFVVIAGDLYDGDWPCHNTGLHFVKQMTTLRDAGIKVYVIQGNHDAANVNTRHLRLPDNVTVLPTDAPMTLHLDDWKVALHGQGYATRAVEADLAAGYPQGERGWFNLGLLHTCAEDDGNEHGRYAPCTLDGLRSKHYQYWALGHVHGRRGLHAAGDEPVWFPGNIQGRHVREPGPKGCLLVEVNDSNHAEVTFCPLDVLRWETLRVDATDAEDRDAVLDRVGTEVTLAMERSDGLPLAVRVELLGNCRAHAELCKDPHDLAQQVRSTTISASSNNAWVEKVRVLTSPPRRRGPISVGDGPLGELFGLLGELRSDPNFLAGFVAKELGELKAKLPPELRSGMGTTLDDPSRLRDALDDLIPGLLGHLGVDEADFSAGRGESDR